MCKQRKIENGLHVFYFVRIWQLALMQPQLRSWRAPQATAQCCMWLTHCLCQLLQVALLAPWCMTTCSGAADLKAVDYQLYRAEVYRCTLQAQLQCWFLSGRHPKSRSTGTHSCGDFMVAACSVASSQLHGLHAPFST
jgi:hypothetical protein